MNSKSSGGIKRLTWWALSAALCLGAGSNVALAALTAEEAARLGGSLQRAEAAPPDACHESRVSVSLQEGGAKNQSIFVKLCMPTNANPSVVQLLLHGATYNNRYWDFPDPRNSSSLIYNYVAAATKAGYATLSIDRIGIGKSSHPLSAWVDGNANAWVVHQLVAALRSGAAIARPNGVRPAFSKVVLVGHSFGSVTAELAASRYKDVDGVVITGMTHYPTVTLTDATNAWPVTLDPKFGLLSYDPGYLTTRPGVRYELLYTPAPADPEVVALDEQWKETTTAAEGASLLLFPNQPLDIRVPVLMVMGAVDRGFCGEGVCQYSDALVAKEAPHLGPNVPSVEGYVLPGAGHMLNLGFNAQAYFDVVQAWVRRNFGH
ncbi:MAG TPA: alpha/beta fold hydrolase [Burkholderiaceae bacterium]|nr:alpha/beta fold hydrolase [Burkholderiaceae bacterium]